MEELANLCCLMYGAVAQYKIEAQPDQLVCEEVSILPQNIIMVQLPLGTLLGVIFCECAVSNLTAKKMVTLHFAESFHRYHSTFCSFSRQ